MDFWNLEIWAASCRGSSGISALSKSKNEVAQKQIEIILAGDAFDAETTDNFRLGITYTFATALSESALRSIYTKYLVRLANSASATVDRALSGRMFRPEQLLVNDYSHNLLLALLERPTVLVRGGPLLIECLRGLLKDKWRSKLICRITKTLIYDNSKQLDDVSIKWPANAENLADTAITLHRNSKSRELDLELCELLMQARAYGLVAKL